MSSLDEDVQVENDGMASHVIDAYIVEVHSVKTKDSSPS
jgi:hypothetical protein